MAYVLFLSEEILPSEDFMHWYRLAIGCWVFIVLTWFLSYVLRLTRLIDDSAHESEILIDKKLAEITETPKVGLLLISRAIIPASIIAGIIDGTNLGSVRVPFGIVDTLL